MTDSERLVLRPPGEQAGPADRPVIGWCLEFLMALELVDNEPVREMAIAHYIERARADADAGGYDLIGEPAVSHVPAVWVENWSDQGGALVPGDVALMAGHFGTPSGRHYRIEWRAALRKPVRRMKRSDIDDQHVLDLARAWQEAPLHLATPGVIQALVDEGIPPRLAYAKVAHLSMRGYLEWGVSANYAWPTGKRLP